MQDDVERIVRGRSVSIIPVIHYADANQTMRNAERAVDAGCDGVMLIEMRGRNGELPFAAAAIKRHWPGLTVGVNHLCVSSESAIIANVGIADVTWTDEQLTHTSGAFDDEAERVKKLLDLTAPHVVFCAVAFKYQAPEPHPAWSARRALSLGFIPTTSGPATGMAADPGVVAAIRETVGPDAPLAIASGITPDNAASFLPLVSHVLVSTGVSSSFHEFDPAKLRDLVAVRSALLSSTQGE